MVSALALGVSVAPASAALPGGNGRIAFERYDDDANTTLWDVVPGVSGIRALTRIPTWCQRRDPYWSDERPRYSPDGEWIAYVHEDDCRDATSFQRQVRIMREDGTGNRILRRFNDGSRAYDDDGLHPVFTANGKRLFFSTGDGSAWVIGAGSGRRVRRAPFPGGQIREGYSYWTFDRSRKGRVVLTLRPERSRSQPNQLQGVGLFVGRLGQAFRRLTMSPQRRNLYGIDGNADSHPYDRSVIFERQLLCVRGRTGCPVNRQIGADDIYIAEPGHRTRRMTRHGAAEQPAFAPDGTRFVYVSGVRLCVRVVGAGRDEWCGPEGASPSWQPL